MNTKKKFLYLALILAVTAVAVPTGLSYAQSMMDQKLESINQLFAQKGESLNTGQFRFIEMNYAYCMNYENYLANKIIPISGIDKLQCLDGLEKFLKEI